MAILDPDLRYYAITLTADANGELSTSTHTHFGRWGDPDHRTEIRLPSLINPETFMGIWRDLNEGFWIAKNDDEWFVFFLLGGNGLVEEATAKRNIPSLFRADPAVPLPPYSGFSSEQTLVSAALRRVPTAKLRGNVMKRDGRRCRICGRDPRNHVDLELNVHHIRPWGNRGPTIKENLITLCQTCHKGLDPHEDHSLFALLPKDDERSSFNDRVRRHREIIFSCLKSASSDKLPRRTRS